jgi:Ca2+-transporting ATPase
MSPQASAQGLTHDEAALRLAQDGPNELQRAKVRSPVWLFLEQLRSPMILLLIGAAVLAGVMGELADAIAIITIVLLNAVVGFFQEYRAEKAVLALRSLTAPRARVLRDGAAALIPAREVVVGDVLVLEAGDLVGADATVLETHRLHVNEASLTGESAPVQKSNVPAPEGAPLAEQVHRVFMGTPVLDGTGKARVTATGMRTELGRIATLLEGAEEEETPLQKQLVRVGQVLVVACLAVVAVVALVGVVHGRPWLELLLSSVSLAVAAVPEGLPAIVTIALAVGVQRMARRHVLVRRLPAVEALGSTTVIATDKTGTLTTGEMTVREVVGDEPAVLAAAAACCDATLDEGKPAVGDPTELALLRAAKARGLDRAELERTNPRVAENPFDSVRKRMSVRRADGVLYVKGAPESVLPLCEGDPAALTTRARELSAKGLRVLAVATGRGTEEAALTALGLVGLADPPRKSAVEALRHAHAAGIRTVMMTGDHPATAEAIAREMGLVLEGESSAGAVHARVTPEEKLKLVRELKAQGHIVAVTGDGTNDAPALKEAHVGIAMGRTGVEVTREAADLVLADDDYASIIAAVQEGRGIFENIRKSLVYLLGGNTAELAVVFLAGALGFPVPLLPLHLLWINLVTDSLPALALVMDPASPDALKRPPRPPSEAMLGAPQWRRVAALGGLVAAVSFIPYVLLQDDLVAARAVAFSTLVFAQVFAVFAARSTRRTLGEVGLLTNLRLVAVVVLTVALQLGAVLWPWSARLLDVAGVEPRWLVLSFGLGLVPATALELWKLVRRIPRRASLEASPAPPASGRHAT